MATRRQRRKDRKFRGLLLCEACNRWTAVRMETWRDTIKALREDDKPYLCLCARTRCRSSRPETLISHLSEEERRKIVYA